MSMFGLQPVELAVIGFVFFLLFFGRFPPTSGLPKPVTVGEFPRHLHGRKADGQRWRFAKLFIAVLVGAVLTLLTYALLPI